jgi:hypothetical protein
MFDCVLLAAGRPERGGKFGELGEQASSEVGGIGGCSQVKFAASGGASAPFLCAATLFFKFRKTKPVGGPIL